MNGESHGTRKVLGSWYCPMTFMGAQSGLLTIAFLPVNKMFSTEECHSRLSPTLFFSGGVEPTRNILELWRFGACEQNLPRKSCLRFPYVFKWGVKSKLCGNVLKLREDLSLLLIGHLFIYVFERRNHKMLSLNRKGSVECVLL